MHDDFELIHSYSRRQANEDGVLVDISETAREAGFTLPVALTAAVYEQYVKVPDGVTEFGIIICTPQLREHHAHVSGTTRFEWIPLLRKLRSE